MQSTGHNMALKFQMTIVGLLQSLCALRQDRYDACAGPQANLWARLIVDCTRHCRHCYSDRSISQSIIHAL